MVSQQHTKAHLVQQVWNGGRSVMGSRWEGKVGQALLVLLLLVLLVLQLVLGRDPDLRSTGSDQSLGLLLASCCVNARLLRCDRLVAADAQPSGCSTSPHTATTARSLTCLQVIIWLEL